MTCSVGTLLTISEIRVGMSVYFDGSPWRA